MNSKVQQILERIMRYKTWFRVPVEIKKNYDDLVVLHIGFDDGHNENYPTEDTWTIVIGESISWVELNDISILAIRELEEEYYSYYASFKNGKLSDLDSELIELIINGYEAPEPAIKDIYYDAEGNAFDEDCNYYPNHPECVIEDFDRDYIFVDENGNVCF